MWVLYTHGVFALPCELRSSLGVPSNFDDRDATLLKSFDFAIHDFDRFLSTA